MTTRVLLVGMSSFDSGKTTFAGLLIDRLYQHVSSIEYFKPISAHNYWQRFEHTQQLLDQRRIFSADLASIKSKVKSQKDEYTLNPIHRLYVPTSPEKPLLNVPTTLGLAGPDSVIALQRFSWHDDRGMHSLVLAAESLVRQGHLLLSFEELQKLTEGVRRQAVISLEEIQQYEDTHLEGALTSSFAHVEEGTDLVVIESFNDTAWIWEGLDRVDLVIVIGPGQAFSYDPERFRKAAFLEKRPSMPMREVTFSRINDLLKPIGRDKWSPRGLQSTKMIDSILAGGPSKKS
jgi:predicted P-loop ATPase/GTPase